MSHMNFSSLPPEQEATFVVYEQQMEQAEKKGWTIGIIVSAVVLVLSLAIFFGVEPDKHDISETMDMSNLTKKSAAPAPAAAPAEAPAAPAEAPAAPAEKPAE
jgi:hypothetical protein